jgi:hypothetical protein
MSRNIKQSMVDYIPRYYGDSRIVDSLLSAESNEVIDLNASINDALDQFFIDTATWGLTNWERTFGLKQYTYQNLTWNQVDGLQLTFADAETDSWTDLQLVANELSFEQRRSNIKSRMRGIGTTTADQIKEIVKSYTNGDVDVIEDSVNYTVTIKFVNVVGVPPNLDDAKVAIQEVIPAHLNVVFTNEYSLWNDVNVTTWGHMNTNSYAWDDVKGGLWNA